MRTALITSELKYKGEAQTCIACKSGKFTSKTGRPPFNCAWCKREWSPEDVALRERIQQLESEGEVARLLRPKEVADLFGVSTKSVTRWAKANKVTTIKTLGGHRRYFDLEIQVLLEKNGRGSSSTAL